MDNGQSQSISKCCTFSSQVNWISHASKSNKGVYCIEILYKYDHTYKSKWHTTSHTLLLKPFINMHIHVHMHITTHRYGNNTLGVYFTVPIATLHSIEDNMLGTYADIFRNYWVTLSKLSIQFCSWKYSGLKLPLYLILLWVKSNVG